MSFLCQVANSAIMSSEKRFASGSQKRKQKAKVETQIEKIPKIISFFPDQLSSDLAGTSTSTEAPGNSFVVDSNLKVNADQADAEATQAEANSITKALAKLETGRF